MRRRAACSSIDLDDRQARRVFAWQEGEWAAVQGPWFEQTGASPSLSGEQAQVLLDDYSQALSSGKISTRDSTRRLCRT